MKHTKLSISEGNNIKSQIDKIYITHDDFLKSIYYKFKFFLHGGLDLEHSDLEISFQLLEAKRDFLIWDLKCLENIDSQMDEETKKRFENIKIYFEKSQKKFKKYKNYSKILLKLRGFKALQQHYISFFNEGVWFLTFSYDEQMEYYKKKFAYLRKQVWKYEQLSNLFTAKSKLEKDYVNRIKKECFTLKIIQEQLNEIASKTAFWSPELSPAA